MTDRETPTPSAGREGDGAPVRLPTRPAQPNPDTRPVRKDEIELADRGLHVESWLPERRSRRKPLLFVHGELSGSWAWERYLGYFARRGWEGHAAQPAEPLLVADRRSCQALVRDVHGGCPRRARAPRAGGRGRGSRDGRRSSRSRRPSDTRSEGSSSCRAYLPRELRTPPEPHELREIPDAYGQAVLGWDTLPELLQREHRDLTLTDILRIQHLLGQKPRESGAARRQMLQGIPIDRRQVGAIPILVIGGGLDRYVAEPDAERLARWLGATYEPFGAHSHYGLILGEESYQQVADAIRAFLEVHRL